MNNSNYDSLAKKLMQSGILPSDESLEAQESEINIFTKHEQDKQEESFLENNAIQIPPPLQKPHKRLNQSDIEMVSEKSVESDFENSFKIIKRFLDFKQKLASKKALGGIENFLFTFFPKLYKAKLAKDAMAKLKELNIDTKKLLEKTIPYGEGELRYESLIKYISCANEIQTKIKKEII